MQSGDPRTAWVITDLMRFSAQTEFDLDLAVAASRLLGVELDGFRNWHNMTDHLIAWDVPAFPGYLEFKREIFTFFEPGWAPLMVEGEIDWRLVSWGGVLIDDRAHDETDQRCNCIPAADNPDVVPAAEATWPADDAIVFGIEVNGEYRAYPRQIMEVREMVNDTLGGRPLAIPYCTLCGAAQAYFTDELPLGVERPIMRTSGLLIRSNKVMYDLISQSVFDTFRGVAVTGPLAEIGLELEQATVVTTDWGTWRTAHPETTVLSARYALGRNPDFRNTRDADGPIFPIGGADPRLPVHEDVIGVIAASGTPWAFSRAEAMAALILGQEVGARECAAGTGWRRHSGCRSGREPTWAATRRSGSPGRSFIPIPSSGTGDLRLGVFRRLRRRWGEVCRRLRRRPAGGRCPPDPPWVRAGSKPGIWQADRPSGGSFFGKMKGLGRLGSTAAIKKGRPVQGAPWHDLGCDQQL